MPNMAEGVVSRLGADPGTGLYDMMAPTACDRFGFPSSRLSLDIGHR
ncbi:unnamed protein product [Dibothriocephalus latus]|uniref:Uncharacterized protein n=1 Tax=Dibothriocephalus latus TaxID=60516 RepID=A0A3P6SC52_DIBLA|nr:unnamed protein product [Dibothriocephalus latus]